MVAAQELAGLSSRSLISPQASSSGSPGGEPQRAATVSSPCSAVAAIPAGEGASPCSAIAAAPPGEGASLPSAGDALGPAGARFCAQQGAVAGCASHQKRAKIKLACSGGGGPALTLGGTLPGDVAPSSPCLGSTTISRSTSILPLPLSDFSDADMAVRRCKAVTWAEAMTG